MSSDMNNYMKFSKRGLIRASGVLLGILVVVLGIFMLFSEMGFGSAVPAYDGSVIYQCGNVS